jgi:hypothetical protein
LGAGCAPPRWVRRGDGKSWSFEPTGPRPAPAGPEPALGRVGTGGAKRPPLLHRTYGERGENLRTAPSAGPTLTGRMDSHGRDAGLRQRHAGATAGRGRPKRDGCSYFYFRPCPDIPAPLNYGTKSNEIS